MNRLRVRTPIVALAAASFVLAAATVPVGEFSQGKLDGWESKAFKGKTDYALVDLNGRTALRAQSHAAASGLLREIRVDLNQTPYLNWSWCAQNTLDKLDEQTKSGDDYPARIYVVVSGGLAFWRTRSLNYVWASTTPRGRTWPNAYAGDHVIMLALRSGTAEVGQWRQEKRDVRADLQSYFGESISHIDAVALMTDTDNSGRSAVAYYGDIYFSAQ